MKTITVMRDGRPATAEELNCAVEGKPLPPLTGSETIDASLYHNLRHQFDLRLDEANRLRNAIDAIRAMAQKRKTCIRMPDGRMLENFCRDALSPNEKGQARRE